jgi:hypothetical protein
MNLCDQGTFISVDPVEGAAEGADMRNGRNPSCRRPAFLARLTGWKCDAGARSA